MLWLGSTCERHRYSTLDTLIRVRLEKECACILQAEAAAAATGTRPISITPEVAQFTFKETGTEEAGAFEMTSFVS